MTTPEDAVPNGPGVPPQPVPPQPAPPQPAPPQPVPPAAAYPQAASPPGFPYAPPAAFPAPYPTKRKSNGFALTSMILGILSITVFVCLLFFPVLPILAVVFGQISLGQIRKTGAPGRGFAIAGLVTGYIGIALALLWLIGMTIGTFTSPTPTF